MVLQALRRQQRPNRESQTKNLLTGGALTLWSYLAPKDDGLPDEKSLIRRSS
jgi:hypothetical protein